MEFGVLREGSKAENKITTLDFRRADFMDPLIRIPHNLPNYSKILGNCQKSKKFRKQEVYIKLWTSSSLQLIRLKKYKIKHTTN